VLLGTDVKKNTFKNNLEICTNDLIIYNISLTRSSNNLYNIITGKGHTNSAIHGVFLILPQYITIKSLRNVL